MSRLADPDVQIFLAGALLAAVFVGAAMREMIIKGIPWTDISAWRGMLAVGLIIAMAIYAFFFR